MNKDILYRNVLRGLQESPLLPGCERSPMTSLTNTFLGASLANTPCKRLSLSSSLSDTPQSLKDESFTSASKESQSFEDSSFRKYPKSPLPSVLLLSSPPNKENLATPYYSPSHGQNARLKPGSLKEVHSSVTRTLSFSPLKKPVSPARREHLSPLKNPTPPDDCDSNSRDSGYSESGQKRDGFNVPRACAPTRRLNLDMSPKYSPFKSPPEGRRVRSFASLKKKSEEDEFLMEFICGARDISMDEDEEASSSFSSLLSAPIQPQSCPIINSAIPVPNIFSGPRLPIRRCLSMIDTSTPVSSRVIKQELEGPISDSFEELTAAHRKALPVSFKRPKSPLDCSFTLEPKRRKDDVCVSPVSVQCVPINKSETVVKSDDSPKVPLSHRQLSNPESCSKDLVRPKFIRSHSESHVSIMKALTVSANNNSELTGDFTQPLLLPTIEGGKHPDLKSISIHTMAAVIQGEFKDKIASFKVLDCRYPYEYEGGHITTAVNWYNLKMVQDYLNAQKAPPKISDADAPRHIHIFHCEFSAERGPKAQRLLREIDRTANKEHYPALHFPEIYLLEGGYKAFYEAYRELCTPTNYVKMLDEKHSENLKFFRSKSRSWATENKQTRCPTTRAGPKRLGL